MNKKDFENLVASVKQAGKIKRGEMTASLTICKGSQPRAGWAAAARRMHERGEDRLLDPSTSTLSELENEFRSASGKMRPSKALQSTVHPVRGFASAEF